MDSPIQKLAGSILLYSLPIAILGALFRLLHYPGANYMLLVGLGSVPFGAILKYFPEKTIDGYLTGLLISVGCIAVLCKLMLWPYSELLTTIAITLGVALSVKTLFTPAAQEKKDE